MQTSLGHGIGMRSQHFDAWLHGPVPVPWTECITENILDVGGLPRTALEAARARMPVVFHGVSLSIGGGDPLDSGYLASVRRLCDEIEPAWISDHLCWTAVGGHHLHDLLPLPYTEEALEHVTTRLLHVHELLGRPIALENPSTYFTFAASTIPEHEFLTELARRTGCGLLLDVNNVYVGSRNHGFSAEEYVDSIPPEALWQIHLAGHSDLGDHLLDTHDAPVVEPVWRLYERVIARCGPRSTLIEWDDRIPPIEDVIAEAHRAAAAEQRALGRGAP
jgi:hypothetical protein